MTASEPRRRRLATVRTRTTAAAVVVVGVALAVAGIVLLVVLRGSLDDSVRTAARLRAEDLAEEIERGVRPGDLTLEAEDDIVVQVLDDRGRVTAASPNVEAAPLVARPQPGRAVTRHDLRVGGHGPEDFLVFAERADLGGGAMTVLVGRSLAVVGESTGVVTQGLLIGVPLLLMIVGLTAWRLAGRALAPVEAIRSEVEAISASELHRRVPDPPGDDEVARLARTMNDMLVRLDHAQARQRRLVSDASHELRSPVATVRHHAEVARAHPDTTTVGDLADTVLAESLRLEHLVDDLLWLARADEHTAAPARTPVDLDDLVSEEAARLRSASRLHIDTGGVSGGQVLGDADQLRHLLRNLGDNAARHATTTVAFAVRERAVDVVLTVDDDGAGIPPEHRERVFERFTRLDDARSRDRGGSGLGLAIVAAIVERHGGEVRAISTPLGGARIEVHLPSGPVRVGRGVGAR